LNLRPSGYEPDELPDCSTPHQKGRAFYKCLARRATAQDFRPQRLRKIRVGE
jgi:hypothetical protein